MYRWHIMDPIRFGSDLRVTIQALGWRSGGATYLCKMTSPLLPSGTNTTPPRLALTRPMLNNWK